MIRQFRIKNIADKNFEEARVLYNQTFPPEERRSLKVQQKLLELDNYHYEIIEVDKQFVGFMLWFSFPEFYFIEHLATIPQVRGQGIGKQVLEQFQKVHSKTILLEVELPHSEINQRRIGFYKRLGFHYNDFEYFQPPFSAGEEPLELRIMSYPRKLSETDINEFVKDLHPKIYG